MLNRQELATLGLLLFFVGWYYTVVQMFRPPHEKDEE